MEILSHHNIDLSQIGTHKVKKQTFGNLYKPIHFHNEFQVTLIKEGRGILYMSDKVVPFRKGDLYFFGKNLPHLFKPSPNGKKDKIFNNYEAITLFFDQNKIKKSLYSLPEAYGINRLIDYSSYGVKIPKKNSNGLDGYLKEIENNTGMDKLLMFLKFLNAASKNDNIIALSSKAAVEFLGAERDPRIRKVCEFVKTNYREEVTLSLIASMVNMSPTGFCRFFKSKSNITFSEYLIEVRIGNVCRLLNEEGSNVSDSCYASGYNSLSNFHKHFKRILGMSPSEYLKNILKNKKNNVIC